MSGLSLPNNWEPRPYQVPLWKYLAAGGLRAVCNWHRRAGKDEIALHHAACASQERVTNLWHMLPEYAQARKAIWDAVNPHSGKRRIDEAFPHAMRRYTREHEMSIGFNNGSTWQVVGSDNFNSLMGTSPGGIVMSEYALGRPAAWGYLSPILMENKGWAVFISTPRGKNHFWSLMNTARDEPDWFSQTLTADQTEVFAKGQLDGELRRLQDMHGDDYGLSLWRQEYFGSFDAAIVGAIWADCVEKAEAEGRVTADVPVEPGIPVNTAWDLGFSDDTVIWFYQIVATEIRIIDYYAASGKDLPHYARLLKDKAGERGFKYGTHYLPHDARPRALVAGGKSIFQQLGDLDIGRRSILPRLDREEGIQAARATFPRCWFDAKRCAKGIEHLRNYHREWDAERKVFRNAPEHDASSHAADAWRYLSLSWRLAKPEVPDSPLMDKLLSRSVNNMSFGALKQKFFARRAREREQRI